jgi:hypothetical protein
MPSRARITLSVSIMILMCSVSGTRCRAPPASPSATSPPSWPPSCASPHPSPQRRKNGAAAARARHRCKPTDCSRLQACPSGRRRGPAIRVAPARPARRPALHVSPLQLRPAPSNCHAWSRTAGRQRAGGAVGSLAAMRAIVLNKVNDFRRNKLATQCSMRVSPARHYGSRLQRDFFAERLSV